MPDWNTLSLVGAFVSAAAGLVAAGHAIVFKRDPRSATIWVLAVLLLPIAGAIAYVLFGINRVNRKAKRIRVSPGPKETPAPDEKISAKLPAHFRSLARLVGAVSHQNLTPGNACDPLDGGHEAYPRMLDAIRQARRSIALATYIFEGKGIGADFIEALASAKDRGVRVKVLIDDVYVRMSFSDAFRPLRAAGVEVALFNPPIIPARLHSVNLRNHRKLLIIDNRVGFTGGMNIHSPYWRPDDPESAMRDLHFELTGPILGHLRQAFARDWFDSTDQWLTEDFWGPNDVGSSSPGGNALARGIESGPDETIDRMRWVYMGAINAATSRICIRTPYFLPDQAMIAAINAAALRGVEVDILVPANSDHNFVKWASQAHYWQVMEHGARIFERPGPFDHSKMMMVDGSWVCIGSANWDARSLRLNFEFNVELYDDALAGRLEKNFDTIIAQSERIEPDRIAKLSLPVRLRNGIARLFSPVL